MGRKSLELVGFWRQPEIAHPGPADRKLVEAEHIHPPNRRQRSAVQIRPLRETGANQQAAVAAAGDGELRGGRIFVLDEPLGRADKIIKHILLFELHSRLMPILTVFAAAPEVSNRIHAAHLQPDEIWN